MKNTKNIETINTTKKAFLLYTDYTMENNPVDKDALLELLGDYIYKLEDPRATIMYAKICDSSEEDKELYIEILGDILENMSPEC